MNCFCNLQDNEIDAKGNELPRHYYFEKQVKIIYFIYFFQKKKLKNIFSFL
jgi:hypothetical protein